MTTTDPAPSSLASISPLEIGGVHPLLGAGAEPVRFVQDLIEGSGASLSAAADAIARVEQEVGELWRHAVAAERQEVTDRLVEVSHVLRRAARLLEGRTEIG